MRGTTRHTSKRSECQAEGRRLWRALEHRPERQAFDVASHPSLRLIGIRPHRVVREVEQHAPSEARLEAHRWTAVNRAPVFVFEEGPVGFGNGGEDGCGTSLTHDGSMPGEHRGSAAGRASMM